jgi:excisionase family DNA binding protein
VDKVLTTAECARALGVSESRVRTMIALRQLAARKAGRDWLVSAHALELLRRDRERRGVQAR